MKIAIAQLNTRTCDFAGTCERMLMQVERAKEAGAELVIFGAPTLTGPNPGGLADSEDFLADLMEALMDFASKAPVACLVPVLVGSGAAGAYEVALIRDGDVAPLRLMSYVEFPEIASPEASDVRFRHGDLDFLICLGHESLERMTRGGDPADVIIYISPYCVNTNDETSALASAVGDGCFVQEASRANSWFVGVGGVGGYDEQVFAGGSFVLTPWGELDLVLPAFEEAIGVSDISVLTEGPLESPVTPPVYNRIAHLWDALTLHTRDFLSKAGISEVSLVIEGDLASSALAALLVDAVGPTHVHALISCGRGEAALDDARAVARNLRLQADEIDEASLLEIRSALGIPEQGGEATSIEAAHALLAIRSRVAHCTPIASFDKTAVALEADTLFDRGAALAPFADIWRTDLAALARHRNTISPVIPVSATTRFSVPEVEGLAAVGTTPEACVNAIDAILLLHIERGMGLTSIVDVQANSELVSSVLERVSRLEVWRRALPTAPVLSDRTFRERDWPSGLGWTDRVREDGGPEELTFDPSAFSERLRQQLEDGARPEDLEEQISQVMNMLFEMGQVDPEGDDFFAGGLFSKN